MNDNSNNFVSISEASGLSYEEIITKLNKDKEVRNIVISDSERLSSKQKSEYLKKIAWDMCYQYYTNDATLDCGMLDEWIELMSRMVGFENHIIKMNFLQKRINSRKVVFLGATGKGHLNKDDLRNICKGYGFSDNQIDIRDDYARLTNLNVEFLKNNNKFLGLIVGAVPHSIKGVTSGNLLSHLEENVCDYPPVRVCRDANNNLGFSANTVKQALSDLIRLATD